MKRSPLTRTTWTVVRIAAGAQRHEAGATWSPGAHPAGEQNTIRILLPPETPDNGWTCGTGYVWQVHPDDVRFAEGFPRRRAYVCEHVVELD